MNKLSKYIILAGISALIITDAVLYWSQHLYYEAQRESNETRRIQTLKKSAGLVPLDDRVYYELGQAYYEIAIRNLDEPRLLSRNLDKSIRNFKRSIRLNPGAYQTHYGLARALLYLSYLRPESPDYFFEYWKAAQLTTFDNDLYFEIGRILFSLWEELNDSQKSFTLDILNNVIQSRGNERLWQILQTWAEGDIDYKVIGIILPETPEAFRLYARFLGERSLSLEERQLKLAQAEFMEFEEAERIFSQAQMDFRYYRLQQAERKYKNTYRILDNINFYQNLLPGQILIDPDEYEDLYKLSLLGVIKSLVFQSGTAEEVKDYFNRYLELEKEPAVLEKLEEFFEERNWLELKPGAEDFPLRLYYRLRLDYAQNRYREIVRLDGRAGEAEYAFQGEYKPEMKDIFRFIGDSYQKIDFLYDAVDYYRKALQFDPDDLKTLFQLRESYARLNNEEELEEVQNRINTLLTPEEVNFEPLHLEKNRLLRYPLRIQDENVVLSLFIQSTRETLPPLLSIYVNGEVVEEKYLETGKDDGVIEIPLFVDSVENNLGVRAVNQDIYLEKIKIVNKNN